MSVTVHFIQPENNGQNKYQILLYWKSDNFSMLVAVDEDLYEGNVGLEFISEKCKLLQITADDYINECKLAFSEIGAEGKFIFTLNTDCLIWKKRLDNDVTLLFGEANLELVNSVMMKNLFRFIAANDGLRSNVVCNKQDQIELLRSNCKKLFTVLTRAKKMNTELRRTLCSRFLTVLNAKKLKIKSLQKQISDSTLVKKQ